MRLNIIGDEVYAEGCLVAKIMQPSATLPHTVHGEFMDRLEMLQTAGTQPPTKEDDENE